VIVIWIRINNLRQVRITQNCLHVVHIYHLDPRIYCKIVLQLLITLFVVDSFHAVTTDPDIVDLCVAYYEYVYVNKIGVRNTVSDYFADQGQCLLKVRTCAMQCSFLLRPELLVEQWILQSEFTVI